jgi:hypothetical protein
LWPTLRDAARGLLRTPGTTAAIITILALGLGANARMFDLVRRTTSSMETGGRSSTTSARP